MSVSPFSFATASQIRFGRGVATQVIPDLARLGAAPLLVTGARPERVAWFLQALSDAGLQVSQFSVPKEPDVDLVEQGVGQARAARATSVISIGGGAVIDAGKAIAALVPAKRPMLDHLEVVGKGLPLEQSPLPFAALPTTSGTGAEVTRNAVIAVPASQRKVSLRDPQMLPDLAIIDPALTDHCPRDITLASGLDAVTQVIEPYISTRATIMTDMLCRDAIPKGLVALQTLMTGEDADARDVMSWVSLCGGLALANAGLGVVHGLAGPLGGLTSAAHGAICGRLLPHGLRANEMYGADPKMKDRLDDIKHWIAQAFGVSANSALDTLQDWSEAAGLPGLDALGVSESARAQAAHAAATSSSMKANPVALSEAQLAQIMEAAR